MSDEESKTMINNNIANNISSVYFRTKVDHQQYHHATASTVPSPAPAAKPTLPFIGPIQVSKSSIQGRGLFATRDISKGECLFIIEPSVTVPIEKVQRYWLRNMKEEDSGDELVMKLEQYAEIMLAQITRLFLKKNTAKKVAASSSSITIKPEHVCAMSILSQIGDHCCLGEGGKFDITDMDVISNNFHNSTSNESDSRNSSGVIDITTTTTTTTTTATSDIFDTMCSAIQSTDINLKNSKVIQSIIRRNAFGPDFRHYQAIAKYWCSSNNTTNPNVVAGAEHDNKIENDTNHPFGRILSLYPLAATINHSCIPNASRVYTCVRNQNDSELMVVHASQDIKRGEEIVWSYVPTTRLYHDRQKRLHDSFQFNCTCTRCTIEARFFHNNENKGVDLIRRLKNEYSILNIKTTDLNQLPNYNTYHDTIIQFEEDVDALSDSELGSYLRTGMLTFYSNYYNVCLTHHNQHKTMDLKNTMGILQIGQKVHESICNVDRSCPEHLSLLHLYNELCQNIPSIEGMTLKYWEMELISSLCYRYGNTNQIDRKKIIDHTRQVLRQLNGFEKASYSFI